MQVGAPGSFVVLVDGDVVVDKKMFGFPSEEEIVAAVKKRMASAKPA